MAQYNQTLRSKTGLTITVNPNPQFIDFTEDAVGDPYSIDTWAQEDGFARDQFIEEIAEYLNEFEPEEDDNGVILH